MASASSASSSFVCHACRLSLSWPRSSFLKTSTPLIHGRGKKTTGTLPVRLTQDVVSYGRKGSIVPVPVGYMRNYFFPRKMADYLPLDELKQLKRTGTSLERDTLFGLETVGRRDDLRSPAAQLARAAKRDPARSEGEPSRVDLNLMEPEEAFEALEDAIPPTLDFYRTPISPGGDKPAQDASRPANKEAELAAPPPQTSPRQTPDNIYGSVSTSDIATAVRALLANKEYAGRIVLPEEDISFVQVGGSDQRADRIKKLGEYKYEIKIKNHEEPILRMVRVLSDDPADIANQEMPSVGPSASPEPSSGPAGEGAAR